MARSCGGCTQCCRLPNIPELDKPPGVACRHLLPGVGCAIHDQPRPAACTSFECLWLTSPELGEHLRPDRVHAFGFLRGDRKAAVFHAEPEHPHGWVALGREIEQCLRQDHRVVVYIGAEAAILTLEADGIQAAMTTPAAADEWLRGAPLRLSLSREAGEERHPRSG